MPEVLHLLLLVLSLGCFLLAAWNPSPPQWSRLISGGLAFLVASMLRVP
jgi:hypothetical protein